MQDIFNQIENIAKTGNYDIIAKQRDELIAENKQLKHRVNFLESLIAEYGKKMEDNLKGIV